QGGRLQLRDQRPASRRAAPGGAGIRPRGRRGPAAVVGRHRRRPDGRGGGPPQRQAARPRGRPGGRGAGARPAPARGPDGPRARGRPEPVTLTDKGLVRMPPPATPSETGPASTPQWAATPPQPKAAPVPAALARTASPQDTRTLAGTDTLPRVASAAPASPYT